MREPLRLEVNGVDVAYRRAGSGPPLMYFHGMGLTRRWLELYELLAQRFDTVVPEHPGFGDTRRPRWYRDLDDIAIHHADFLTALGFGAVDVVGHSLGGRIAGSFAALFPERVRSLTLITPASLPVVGPPDVDDDGDDEDLDGDRLLFNDNEDAYPEYRNGDDPGTNLADDDGSDPHADPDSFSIDGAPSLYRRLARVEAPAQVLVPDEDRIIPHAAFTAWAEHLGGAPEVHVPGTVHPTGHLLIVQEPQAIADAVAALTLAR